MTRLGQHKLSYQTPAAGFGDYELLRVTGKYIVRITNFTMFNTDAAKGVTYFIIVDHGGKTHRYSKETGLAAQSLANCGLDIYLQCGDSLWLKAAGSGANATFEVSFQVLDVV